MCKQCRNSQQNLALSLKELQIKFQDSELSPIQSKPHFFTFHYFWTKNTSFIWIFFVRSDNPVPFFSFRFMMPKTFTVGEVLAVLRHRLDLTREEGLVLFANQKYMLKPNSRLDEVYGKYKDEDGFLYLSYAEENIYGWEN